MLCVCDFSYAYRLLKGWWYPVCIINIMHCNYTGRLTLRETISFMSDGRLSIKKIAIGARQACPEPQIHRSMHHHLVHETGVLFNRIFNKLFNRLFNSLLNSPLNILLNRLLNSLLNGLWNSLLNSPLDSLLIYWITDLIAYGIDDWKNGRVLLKTHWIACWKYWIGYWITCWQ